MHGWAKVAKVLKSRSSQGGLTVGAVEGLPFLLSPPMEVAFVPPRLDAPRRARVASVNKAREGAWLVCFEEPLDARATGLLEGCYCLVPSQSLPAHALEPLAERFEGFEVVDERFGRIGKAAQIIEGPAQSLLKVQGDSVEILIPFVDELIAAVDYEERVISTRVPSGLLELGQPAAKPCEDARGRP